MSAIPFVKLSAYIRKEKTVVVPGLVAPYMTLALLASGDSVGDCRHSFILPGARDRRTLAMICYTRFVNPWLRIHQRLGNSRPFRKIRSIRVGGIVYDIGFQEVDSLLQVIRNAVYFIRPMSNVLERVDATISFKDDLEDEDMKPCREYVGCAYWGQLQVSPITL